MFQTETVQRRVYKSLKLWSMYADLEESLGTFQVIIHVVAVIKDCGEFPFSIREMHSLPAAWKLASCMFRFHVADVFCMCSGHILNLPLLTLKEKTSKVSMSVMTKANTGY